MPDSCAILLLPGELRNAIYHYVSTKEHGLTYRREHNRFFVRVMDADSPSMSELLEENLYQIQQVCRQLRNESRGYFLRFNDLYFENFEDAAHFFSTASSSDVRCLGTLQILDGQLGTDNIPAEGLHKVKELCAEYPHIFVQARQPKPHLDSHLVWAHMLLIQFMHRGSVDLVHRLILDTRYRSDLVQVNFEYAYGMTTERPPSVSTLPDNLRICLQEELFTEVALRMAVENSEQLTHIVEHGLNGDISHWVKVMQELYRGGC